MPFWSFKLESLVAIFSDTFFYQNVFLKINMSSHFSLSLTSQSSDMCLWAPYVCGPGSSTAWVRFGKNDWSGPPRTQKNYFRYRTRNTKSFVFVSLEDPINIGGPYIKFRWTLSGPHKSWTQKLFLRRRRTRGPASIKMEAKPFCVPGPPTQNYFALEDPILFVSSEDPINHFFRNAIASRTRVHRR